MKNILVLGKYYHPFRGGIEDNTVMVSEYIATRHRVTVVASNHNGGDDEEMINGVRVIRKKVDFNIKGQPISLNFFSGINIEDFDIIHFHSPNPALAAQLVAKCAGKKWPRIVVTHHMDIFGRRLLRQISIPFMNKLFSKADRIIVTSIKNANLSRDLPKNKSFAVIPLGIDPLKYKVTPEFQSAAHMWRRSLAGDAPVVGFVGRHARYKGLDTLIAAVAQIDGLHAFVGGSGPLTESLRDQTTALGVSDRVHFLGLLSHEEKVRLLISIDAFIFPSTEITEAFGISQLEAMICGAPVIASNLPTGVSDVSINGHTALTFSPGDIGGLVDRIQIIISDTDMANKLKLRAVEHVLSEMTRDVICKKTIDVIEGNYVY